MALSMELLKRLNTDEEPLNKRLRLAENTFYANDIPIIRKEDLILQWLCTKSATNKTAWNSLKNCLKTRDLDVKSTVKKCIIDMLIERFQNDSKNINEDIFECCTLLISNIGIQQYFLNKPEHLGCLTRSLLECVFKMFNNAFKCTDQSIRGINISLINECDGLLVTAYNATISIMESMMQIIKSALDTKDQLRIMFISDVLYPLCAIIDHNTTDNTNRLGAITHKCIQQLIFGKKRNQNEESSRNVDISELKTVLPVWAEIAKTKNLTHNVVTFTFLFRVALHVFKLDTVTLDVILRELVKCSGIYRKETLESFLCNLNDVTFDFNNKIHDVTLLDYLESVAGNILNTKSINDTDYNLLVHLCRLNPLIIEKRIRTILKKVFLEKSKFKRKTSIKKLMISILNASVHTRQQEKLISSILIALKECLDQTSDINVEIIFSSEFREEFTSAMNNITNSQAASMLRTLIYHLRTDCPEILESKDPCTNDEVIVMLKAIVELLSILLSGTSIYGCSDKSVSYKKFVCAFNDLKNALLFLLEKTSLLSHNPDFIQAISSAIYVWNEAQMILKYYMHSNILEDLESPISEVHWQHLVTNVKDFQNGDCQNNPNNLILQQIKIASSMSKESLSTHNDTDYCLKSCWKRILEFDTDVIPFLSNEEVLKLTYLLLHDISDNANVEQKWCRILQMDGLQENKRFIIYLLYNIFVEIKSLLPQRIKSISKHFTAEVLLQIELNRSDVAHDILSSMKEKMIQSNWIRIQDELLCNVKVYLELLLQLPLPFLSTNLRLITFMYVFTLRLECNSNKEILLLFDSICADILEKCNINVFQYVDPPLLLQKLPKTRITQKALEPFLRNCSYSMLKELVKSFNGLSEDLYFLLDSMEYVKSKLNGHRKAIIKKAERKVIKIVMKRLPCELTRGDNIKMLTLTLKINISNGRVSESLKNIAETTIQNIFVNYKSDVVSNESLEDGLQLAVIILHNKTMFQITNQIIVGICHALIIYPRVDVLLPLLELCEPMELSEFLKELHNTLIKALSEICEDNVKNICIIWNSILNSQMSNERTKLRLNAINDLIETVQTVNIQRNAWTYLLKLIENILVAKHLYLPSYVTDMSMFIGLKAMEENTVIICDRVLHLCKALLKTRTGIIVDKIPSLLLLYRKILNVTVHVSRTLVNKSEEHTCKCLALDIEKFTNSLIKLKKDMTRISPYLIADLMELLSDNLSANFMKVCLQNCINIMMSICDQHGLALLSRTLHISIQEIFKNQLEAYNKFYKFSGKI